MNKYRGTDKDIHTRIYRFVVGCFHDVVKKIPKTPENIPTIQQLSSSLTSMGANDQEADAALTKKDFIAKYVIVRKETSETQYWLSFVRDAEILSSTIVDSFVTECIEIRNVVSSIIENSKS